MINKIGKKNDKIHARSEGGKSGFSQRFGVIFRLLKFRYLNKSFFSLPRYQLTISLPKNSNHNQYQSAESTLL